MNSVSAIFRLVVRRIAYENKGLLAPLYSLLLRGKSGIPLAREKHKDTHYPIGIGLGRTGIIFLFGYPGLTLKMISHLTITKASLT